ncbi:MAG: cupin [Chloroflexia bacterium]|nr:cupin [Chloroflexia bacterium]
MSVQKFSIQDAPLERFVPDQDVFLGDVINQANGDSMSVGWARYSKGARNEYTITYDEALIVTKGRFTVRSAEGDLTANAGEVIYLSKGTAVTYIADEDCDVVYVTYPFWRDAAV